MNSSKSTIANHAEKDSLLREIEVRDQKIVQQDQKIIQLDQEVDHLKEQLAWFKRQVFGKRSEREVSNLNSQQLILEDFESPKHKAEEKKKVAAHERKKPNRDGKDKIILPDDLPVQTIVLDIPEEEKVCPETGVPLVQIGVEVSHKLAHKPGSFFIKEIIRPKYAHPKKEETAF